jgi:nucleotide-binding universal stress UspA family protein
MAKLRILVPIDGSKTALRALRHAAALARVSRAQVRLLNVQPPMPLYGMVRAYLHERQYREACAGLAARALAPAQHALRRAGVAHQADVAYGEPGATIAATAHRLKCASIVMGTRGLGSVEGLLLGSVATKVIHLAKVPVTLIK